MPPPADIVKVAIEWPGAFPKLMEIDQVSACACVLLCTSIGRDRTRTYVCVYIYTCTSVCLSVSALCLFICARFCEYICSIRCFYKGCNPFPVLLLIIFDVFCHVFGFAFSF
uniref:Uncharacterized protein n=1 Tax=Anas platyrhynchos platyrhynchos TaxID=8840 RepID=A0A493T7M5_ANAPP